MSTSVLKTLLVTVTIALTTAVAPVTAQEEKKTEEAADKKDKKDLPLEPERKVQFQTDEGTWISLDVSPDGGTIVFELLGDLYTIPIQGGPAKRITEGMAYDTQPRFSPDGKWLAFISDRSGSDNVWVANADGSEPRNLSEDRGDGILSPTWMPDSQYVMVTKRGRRGYDFWIYHLDGGSGVNLTGPAERPSPGGDGPPGGGGGQTRLGAAVSPDARYLYYTRSAGGGRGGSPFGWQIARRDLENGDEDALTQADGGAIRPALSPDGRQLVYATRYEAETGLRIRDLETGTDRWLRYPVQRDAMESGTDRDLMPSSAFTPDGNYLITTFEGKIQKVDIQTGASEVIPFQADVELDIGPRLNFPRRVDEGPVRARLLQDPVFSPDGKRLAFSAMAHLYVMDVPGGKPRRLTSDPRYEFKPTWSPDGQWIAYVSWDYAGDGHIWKIRADGSGQAEQLTEIAAFYTDPVFSPDGGRIVARRGNAWMRSQTFSEFGGLRIQLDLIWLPSEGGDVRLIVPARGLGLPHFGPEQDQIHFYSRGGLISLRYDGTDRRTHLKVVGRPTPRSSSPPPAEGVVLSPDGKWALAKLANQVFVTAVPRVGGDAPTVNVFSPPVPVKQLTDIGADSFGWADGGKTVAWAVGTHVFRRSLDSIAFQSSDRGGSGSGRNRPQEQAEEAAETEQDQEADPEKKAREEDDSVESFEIVLEFPRYQPEGTVVLRGATAITMNGDEVIEDAVIVVKGNRIETIGASSQVEVPEGAREFDVSGKYIVPGFVDTHAHYEMRTEGVLELHNWSFLANMAYGVTTGLDVQTSTNDYLTYWDLVQAGTMMGPRAYSTGPGVFSSNDFRSGEAARQVLRKYKQFYLNDNLKSYMAGNRQQRQWVVQAAKEFELTTTTEGGRNLKMDLTHAIDGFGGNEHTLPITPLYKDVVQLYAQSHISYTPTLLVLYGGPIAENYFYTRTEVHDDEKIARFTPHNILDNYTRRRRAWAREDEHAFPRAAAQAAKIQRAGGLVGVGGHGQLQGLGYHWEMWALAMGGMTPDEVLKAATIDGARIIGLAQDLGSLEADKLADMVILNSNPLEDIHNTNRIEWVMINGELFVGNTLERIHPTEKEIRPFWWWNSAP